ncbi:sodium/proline symporter PutP [Erythrobacter sp. BLCC-B19]|uniref:sodium/proline symporter PutP n=1 Tax=Erythrobacter sp. BLCC-B19 TaxID=3025315 RepID=UPI00235EE82D|nr:sodium/proline symporter PutP [Erythrobacter sp. BLCC-B19]WDA41205.1 sodium/proline symporter PutP [Erythrobacter sp. BLCC-B19]
MNSYTLASLAAYFLLMIAIGIYAWAKTRNTSEGYLLAGRDLGPAVTALSAGASDMSGWLLLGLPGALFAAGLVEAWIAIGLTIGAALNWIIVAPRLREQTERLGDALTIPQFLANRFPESGTLLRVTSAVVIVGFFTVYTASGMVGGGKLFATAFAGALPTGGLSDYMFGIVLTAGIVLVYTTIGGFLAVSLTDFVQGMIMMVALVVMPLVILSDSGNSIALSAVPQAGFLSLTEGATLIGVISAVTWGLGYFGQPHIIVRFMAIDRVENVPRAGMIGMGWMIISLIGAVAVGLAGRAYAEGNGLVVEDPETIFIILSQLLFHPAVTGFLYAALLAAIMSTIASQLLVSSSSLTEDFYRLFLRRNASEREAVNIGRLSVALVAAAALVIAADPDSEVLGLVSNAWAGFGAAFGPLILLALTWERMTGAGAVAGLVTGAGVVAGWIVLGWNKTFLGGPGLYEIVPGFAASMLAIIVVSLATAKSRAAV